MTTGTLQAYIEKFNLCGEGTWEGEIPLPAGASSYGIAIKSDGAPNGTEVWVTDFFAPKVYVYNFGTCNNPPNCVETITLPAGWHTAAPGHIAFAYPGLGIGSYRAYVTDRASDNRRALVITGPPGSRSVNEITWDPLHSNSQLSFMYTWGIAVDPSSQIAYLTWPASEGNQLLFKINIAANDAPSYFSIAPLNLNGGRGVAWLADGSRAYIGSNTNRFLSIINRDGTPAGTTSTLAGVPYWVATSYLLYNFSQGPSRRR
ncbi:MAG: hypothetical protein HYR55_18670 [Acidobacteria bacterium]|nr:hypothetical protein [Acidobacteriota bacterium]MBI3655040.1 hypothetical protein [Acidobacteriota bacterium]